MTLTFISNYINHHQIPFSQALCELLGEDYHFIQTQPMEQERLSMGWSSRGEDLPYVHCLYEQEELCRRLILESDVLLAGWSGREDLIGFDRKCLIRPRKAAHRNEEHRNTEHRNGERRNTEHRNAKHRNAAKTPAGVRHVDLKSGKKKTIRNVHRKKGKG